MSKCSAAAGARWQIKPDGLVLKERLRTSFQRCARPPGGYFEKRPTSLGSLPLAPDSSGTLFLPMAENEAVWIGLTTVPARSAVTVSVAVQTRAHGTLDVISGRSSGSEDPTPITIRGHHAIDGIFRDDRSVWAFQSESAAAEGPCCKAFIFRLLSGGAAPQGGQLSEPMQIQITNHGEFFALTGCLPPTPLDLNAGYTGWLLP